MARRTQLLKTRLLETPSTERGEDARASGPSLVPVPSPPPADLTGATLGRLVAWTDDGLFVDFAGNAAGPLLAASMVEWRPAQIQEALEKQSPVLLVFEEANVRKPIVVGTLRSVPKRSSLSLPSPLDGIGVQADGERVEVTARDEVVLRCGEASITLRRNGRVVIRGAYVETRARGTNRIKGGNVLIN